MNYYSNPFFVISILVDNRPLEIIEHGGVNWLCAQPGKAYTILVKNISGGRLEVLESVDGRDVLQDKAAALSNNGMVIAREWENRGWRLNDDEIREFVFVDPEAAIANLATGSTSNVGVIGVAVYLERRIVQKLFHGGFASAEVKSLQASDLGTGMGERRSDHIGHTSFAREELGPHAMVEFQYRTREWLLAHGILRPSLPHAWSTGYEKY